MATPAGVNAVLAHMKQVSVGKDPSVCQGQGLGFRIWVSTSWIHSCIAEVLLLEEWGISGSLVSELGAIEVLSDHVDVASS